MAQFRVKSNGKILLIDAEDIGIIDRHYVKKCKSLQFRFTVLYGETLQ